MPPPFAAPAWHFVPRSLDAGSVAQLEPLFDDQESDTRRTTGALYWEGAVRASMYGRAIGQGYLELTGYGQPLKL